MSEESINSLQQRLAARKSGSQDVMEQKVSPLTRKKNPIIMVRVHELRAAIEKNPKHSIAKVYANAVLGQPDSKELAVEMADLEALLDDKEVYEVETLEKDEDGALERVLTKKIRSKTVPAVPPKHRPAPEPAKAP